MTAPSPPAFEPVVLPHDLTGPLHLLEPSPLDHDRFGWWLKALLVLLALAGWWWARRRRAARQGKASPEPVSVVAPAATADVVDGVRRAYDGTGRYREGCHALASSLRTHLGRTLARPLAARTAGEIAAASPGHELGGLFEQLAALQYRRREPEHGEFLAACDLAAEVVDAETKR